MITINIQSTLSLLTACLLFSCAEFAYENADHSLKSAIGSEGSQGYGYLCEGESCRLSDHSKRLLDERVGFGRDTTGGLGGMHCVVHNFADSGEGTLRQCANTDQPVWISFAQSGQVQLQTDIELPSNSTVDGRGHNVVILGAGLSIQGKENVLITHLKIREAWDDAIRVKYESKRVWIHRVSLENSVDGLIDITRGATDITVSWCRFQTHRKTMLISGNHEHEVDKNIRVTVHHNYFNKTYSRHPRVRLGKVHVYNNYFREVGSYAIGCSHLAQCVSERNLFDQVPDPIVNQIGGDPEAGFVKSIGDWVSGNRVAQEFFPEQVYDPRDSYNYEADEANEDLMDWVKEEAGWRRSEADPNQYQKRPTETQCQEDLDTLPIPPTQHSADVLFADGAQIALRASTGHYVSAEDGGGKGLTADREGADAWETFTVIRHNSGRIALQTNRGNFITAESENGVLITDRQNLGEWELFAPVQVDEGRFAFQAHTGLFVVAECGGGAHLAADRPVASAWESFSVELISSSPDHPQPQPQPQDPPSNPAELFSMNSKIHIQALNGQFLCAQGGGGDQVSADRDQASDWETFTVITHDTGLIALQTSEGFYLSADQGGGSYVTADRQNIADWELFEPVALGGDRYALKTINGHYLVAEEGGGAQVTADRQNINDWETLIIKSAR